jgi:hypothetical protein
MKPLKNTEGNTMKTIEVQFNKSCSERFYLYPADLDLSPEQFAELETDGIFKFHTVDIEVERQYYTDDEGVQDVIFKIQDGLENILEQAEKLRKGLTLVPATVVFTPKKDWGIVSRIEKLA